MMNDHWSEKTGLSKNQQFYLTVKITRVFESNIPHCFIFKAEGKKFDEVGHNL